MFKRVEQFFCYLTASVDSEDKIYLHKHLNSDERDLFNKLAIHEQKHSINVARDVEKICRENSIDSSILIKAALMHDIGKIKEKLSLVEKSVIVILDSFSRGRLKKLSKIKKINIYYNHAEEGSNLLSKLSANEKLLYLVRNHDNPNVVDNLELNILKKCDDKN